MSKESYRIASLFNWNRGIRNRCLDLFKYPENALTAGENLILADGGLKTRPGYGVVGELSQAATNQRILLSFTGSTGDTPIIDGTGRHVVTNVAQSGGERMQIDEGHFYNFDEPYSLKVPSVHPDPEAQYRLTVPAGGDFWLGGVYQWPWEMLVCFRRSGALSHKILLAAYGDINNRWEWWYNLDASPGEEKLTFRIYAAGVTVFDQSFTITTSVDRWYSFSVFRNNADTGLDTYNIWIHDLETGNAWGTGWDAVDIPAIAGSPELTLLNAYRGYDVNVWFDMFYITWPPGGYPVEPARLNGLWQVRFPTNESQYLLAQVVDPNNGQSAMYASNTRLPSDGLEFTQICNLSATSSRASVAVLNDRAVIACESVVPQVFAGCMTDDGSDWAYPKAVLVRQDGENAYDISGQVLDKDTDNAADIANIRSYGDMIICTDMPKVDGFYFEMRNPNQAAATVREFTKLIAFDNVADVARKDMKGSIDRWHQDSGATGHFEATGKALSWLAVDLGGSPNKVKMPCTGHGYVAGDTVSIYGTTNYNAAYVLPTQTGGDVDNFVIDASYNAETFSGDDEARKHLTLGMGNDCPGVVKEILVDFGSSDTDTISDIVDDGEGTGEVELRTAHVTADVEAIYGLKLTSDAEVQLTVNHESNEPVVSLQKTQASYIMRGGSIRQIISASELAASGAQCCLTFSVCLPAGLVGSSNPLLQCTHVSIVERSPATANGVTAPTEVTFSGGHGFTLSGVGPTITSDWIDFEIDETKDYLVIMDVSMMIYVHAIGPYTGGEYRVGSGLLGYSPGSGYYFRNHGNYSPQESWNLATVSSYSLDSADRCCALTCLSTRTLTTPPVTLFAAHTTDAVQFPLVIAEAFSGVAAAQSTPGNSRIYHALSLDMRATFQVFKSGAWRLIVRQDAGNWQYNDSATASPNWQNATDNSLLGALQQAFGVSYNQMTGAELAAVSSAQWTTDGGIVIHDSPSMDFALGMQAVGLTAPSFRSYTITFNDAGTINIEGFRNGGWTPGDGWTDNTVVDFVPLAKSGTVTYNGDVPFEADYHVIAEIPGYWYRFRLNGTSSACSITRVLYKAPCQPLANIGDGQPDHVTAFIFKDNGTGAVSDYTVEVSDGTFTQWSKADIPMTADDYLYLAYLTQFNEIEITPYEQNNQAPAVLSADYWNGETWTALTIADGTAVSGKTFSTKGKISWTLPHDWKSHIPLDANVPLAYWLRLHVSQPLTATAAISEVKVYGVPSAPAKHKFAVAVKDRIALLGRPDAPDQADVSRQLEEYGFTGADSGSYRIGGMDAIHCALAAWTGLLVGKTETWHQLVGSTPADFQFQAVEAARHVPINSAVIVKASVGGFDDGQRYGIYFLNRYGAFAVTGLHTDATYGTTRGVELSTMVNWWTDAALPRLDLNNLGVSCGEFWPLKNWVVWAVPMITETPQTEQPTNNRLLVYDLTLGAWLPPFTIPVASMALAYHHNGTAPGKLGDVGLYAGDYQGRVLRLFGPDAATDAGDSIVSWAETGWLHFGVPEYSKVLRLLTVFGKSSGDSITVDVCADGNDSYSSTSNCQNLSLNGASSFAQEQMANNIPGRFFKLRTTFRQPTDFHGLQIGLSLVREWGDL